MEVRWSRILEILAAIIIGLTIVACGGQEPEDLSDSPEIQKFNEAQAQRVVATAHPDDFAAATTSVCSGISIFADGEGWNLPDDTEEVCVGRLTTYFDNYRKWPAATGNPSPAYVVANNLSIDLGIGSKSPRGANFAQKFQGLLNAQRKIYNWP